MRQQATAGTDAALGEAFVAIYDRAFLVGPGFFAGLANGVILGYLMYRSGLVPRGMAMLGLIGGPLVMASGIAACSMWRSADRRSSPSRRSRSSSGSCRSASTASSRDSGLHPSSRWIPRSESLIRRALVEKAFKAQAPACGAGRVESRTRRTTAFCPSREQAGAREGGDLRNTPIVGCSESVTQRFAGGPEEVRAEDE